MRKKLIFVILVLLVLAAGFLSYYYVMKAGARDLEKEEAEFTLSAIKIAQDFSTNSDLASKKYLNRAVEITGIVTDVNQDVITLDGKVSCQLKTVTAAVVNSSLTIKGRLTGYDDLLEEVKLDQCVIIK